MPDWSGQSITELLTTHCEILEELRKRDVVRSKNNPTGDYAEWLVSKKLGLLLENKSAKLWDATDANGVRYQSTGVGLRLTTHPRNLASSGIYRAPTSTS